MKLTNNGQTDIPTLAGQEYALAAQGTFGAGTLKLEYSLDGGTTWTPYADSNGDVALTAAGGRLVVAPSVNSRFNLSGATTPAITVVLTPA